MVVYISEKSLKNLSIPYSCQEDRLATGSKETSGSDSIHASDQDVAEVEASSE